MWDVVVWLNQNSGAVQGAVGLVLLFTLVAVIYYAWQTKQMADEMQKQKLENLRPVIDVELVSLTNSGLVAESLRLEKGLFSEKLRWKVSNIGVGPALEVEVSISHPSQIFDTYEVGTLQVVVLPRERWPISISQKLKEEVNAPRRSPTPAGRSILATYKDVYGRQGQSKRELTFVPGEGIISGDLVVTQMERPS